ncbi:uncharacterized protein V1518DRAFT_422684 [Limtongia smithiae]|uniref:uncharacterized protein n=1 Tax=Limtongia smithiae TaxID=1125753 RepID=UPI0034CD40CC
MYRRKHKKSKNGCSQCKRRHLKCDEQRPKCITCATANFSCSFESEAPRQPSTGAQSVTVSISAYLSRSYNPHENSNEGILVPETADINPLHMELFYHFMTNVANWFYMDNEQDITFPNVLVPAAWEHPFLMYELFALSASHLSERRYAKSSYYLQIASSYHVTALSGLKTALENVDITNCKAVLFASHLIAIHSFRDTFALASTGALFSSFQQRFVECMSLLRGVRTVISPWWAALLDSDIGPVIVSARRKREVAAAREGSETALLKNLVLSADISEHSREIYRATVNELQVEFNYILSVGESNLNSIHLVFTWLMTASREFLVLLEEQRPEALIILAYYGVILHQYRSVWPIRDSGKVLVTAIADHLGQRWAAWLKVPQEMITVLIPVS